MKRPSTRRQRDRQAAGEAAMHALSIKRALELTRDEVAQQALIRLGPVPTTCSKCHKRPPRNYQMVGSGTWLCNPCAGLPEKQTP